MSYVLNNSKAGKEAQELLKKKFNDNAKKFSDLEKSLKKEETDLLDKKTILSKEEYTKRSNSLRKKVIDYQSQRRLSIDDLSNKRATARKTLMEKLKPIIDSYVNENSISIVLDKKNMIAGATEFDITKIIVEKFNKKLPSLNLQ
jgi:Outer membrane protein